MLYWPPPIFQPHKGLGKVKELKIVGMNGMKTVKLEPLIVGMDANRLLMAIMAIMADGLIDWLIGTKSRWWFQIFFIFTPIWGNDPI